MSQQRRSGDYFFCLRPTSFGWAALVWSLDRKEKPEIARIFLPASGRSVRQNVNRHFPGATAFTCPQIDAFMNGIEKFLQGENIRFALALVRLNLFSSFQQKVLRADQTIPRGKVAAYGFIAKAIGRPRGVRAVGTALAMNPLPLVIPCHRVVRSDGTLGGYQGGLKMKRALLEMEGVRFCKNGRVFAEDIRT